MFQAQTLGRGERLAPVPGWWWPLRGSSRQASQVLQKMVYTHVSRQSRHGYPRLPTRAAFGFHCPLAQVALAVLSLGRCWPPRDCAAAAPGHQAERPRPWNSV